MPLIGFRDQRVAERLRDFITNCDHPCKPNMQRMHQPQPAASLSRTFYAVVETDFTAATVVSRSPIQVTPGSTTGKLCFHWTDENGDGDITEYEDFNGETTEITIYNYHPYVIQITQAELVLVQQSRDGNFVLDPGVQNKPFCQFALSSALTTSTLSVSVTKKALWGQGIEQDLVTVYNTLTHTSGTYKFSGDSGDIGEARWDPVEGKWYIIQLECP